jgi:hypothetical protein
MSKNKIKILILAVIGIVSIITIVVSMDEGAPKDEFQNTVPISLKEDNFSYDDVTNAYDKAKKNGEFEKTETRDSNVYSEENDPKVLELQRQIELLEEKRNGTGGNGNVQGNNVQENRPLTEAEKEAIYRSELLRAREERLARSQDYSAPPSEPETTGPVESMLEFQAAIYRDQFILPGDRVTLILTQPVTYKGNVFKKNTFIYANANIQGSRVLLNVTNIDHVPIGLVAKDVQDGNIGMYSERAGQLWREFQADAQTQGINDVTGEISQQTNVPLVGTAIRAFGNFFRKKKYKEKDKILLVNNDKLILTTPLNTRL